MRAEVEREVDVPGRDRTFYIGGKEGDKCRKGEGIVEAKKKRGGGGCESPLRCGGVGLVIETKRRCPEVGEGSWGEEEELG